MGWETGIFLLILPLIRFSFCFVFVILRDTVCVKDSSGIDEEFILGQWFWNFDSLLSLEEPHANQIRFPGGKIQAPVFKNQYQKKKPSHVITLYTQI